MTAIATTSISCWCFGSAFLDLSHFIYKLVRRLNQPSSSRFVRGNIRFAPIQQVQVRHRIVVVRLQLERLLHAFDAFINCRSIFLFVRRTQRRRQRIGVVELAYLVVESLPQLSIPAKCQRPIDHANPVVRLGIIRAKLNMPSMIGLRFLKNIWTERLTTHLKQEGANPIKCGNIVGIQVEHALEFLDCSTSKLLVLFAGRARNVLRCVAGRKIQASVDEVRVESLGPREKLFSFFGLPVPIGLDAAIQRFLCVASSPCLGRLLLVAVQSHSRIQQCWNRKQNQASLHQRRKSICTRHRLLQSSLLRRFYSSSPVDVTLRTARKASCGMSTWPTRFVRFLPSFCFSRSLRLRVMSPP